jgi:hypothetical protein
VTDLAPAEQRSGWSSRFETDDDNPLACDRCDYVASEPKTLGTHRLHAHGIPGRTRQHPKPKAPVRRRGGPPLSDRVVEYLATHPGPHRYEEVAAAVGEDPIRALKSGLSPAKQRGGPVDNDGKGTWWHTGAGPKPASPPALRGPEVLRANGSAREFTQVQGFILLEDSEGGIWLAEKIR